MPEKDVLLRLELVETALVELQDQFRELVKTSALKSVVSAGEKDIQRFLSDSFDTTGERSEVYTGWEFHSLYASWSSERGLEEISPDKLGRQLKGLGVESVKKRDGVRYIYHKAK